jgi:hypothetical protein
MLNIYSITSKIRTTAMFVIIYMLKMFHIEIVGKFMTYLHTTFHVPSANDSLVIAIKQKGNYRFCVTTILLFHISFKIYLMEVAHFLKAYYQP